MIGQSTSICNAPSFTNKEVTVGGQQSRGMCDPAAYARCEGTAAVGLGISRQTVADDDNIERGIRETDVDQDGNTNIARPEVLHSSFKAWLRRQSTFVEARS